jgi:hypothetical protein
MTRPGIEPGPRLLMRDFVMDKSGAGAGFLRVHFGFFIPPISPQSPSPSIRGWYNRPVVTAVPKVPQQKLKKKNQVVEARRVVRRRGFHILSRQSGLNDGDEVVGLTRL